MPPPEGADRGLTGTCGVPVLPEGVPGLESAGEGDLPWPGTPLWLAGTSTGETGGLGAAVGELWILVGAWPTLGPPLPVVVLPD